MFWNILNDLPEHRLALQYQLLNQQAKLGLGLLSAQLIEELGEALAHNTFVSAMQRFVPQNQWHRIEAMWESVIQDRFFHLSA